jgi:hypothetical protein
VTSAIPPWPKAASRPRANIPERRGLRDLVLPRAWGKQQGDRRELHAANRFHQRRVTVRGLGVDVGVRVENAARPSGIAVASGLETARG